MPKPKATEVIVHRLDLQPSMKESMDTFLIGKTLTNAVSAVGSLLAPFSSVLGALAAAWIAKEGAEAAVDKVTGYFEEKGKEVTEEIYGPEREKYMLVYATLKSCTSAEQFTEVHQSLMDSISGGRGIVKRAWVRFIIKYGVWAESEATWPDEVVHQWKQFYPPSAFMRDVRGDVRSAITSAVPFPLSLLV